MHKYPRTPHIQGSGLQFDDDAQSVVPFSALAGKYLVVEEKMDGANCGISFNSAGQLLLQSRGHYLSGGLRERQFHLLKSWSQRYAAELWVLLSDRYVLYGEWLYGKHTIFYTDLPHYLMEFDLYDIDEDRFLATEQRRDLLCHAPFIVSVQVLHAGPLMSLDALMALVGPSYYVAPDHRDQLYAEACAQGLDPMQVLHETDPSGLMEGLYIKVEEGGVVSERYKYVRSDFLQSVLDSGSHWLDRPLLPNQLRKDVSLW